MINYRIFYQPPLLLFLLFFVLDSRCQVLNFSGGNGQGDISKISGQIFLSGSKGEVSFGGGIGGGNSVKGTVQVKLNGANFELEYLGGVGLGSSSFSSSKLFLNGISSDIYFKGGDGSGAVRNNVSNVFLNGLSSEISYSGGVGSGDDLITLAPSTINGISASSFFNPQGGSGRGDSYSISSQLSLSGNSAIFFRGGNGSGSTLSSISQIFLSGQGGIFNFNGGIGRGDFFSNSSQLISLGGIPFVINFPGGNGRGDMVLKSNSLKLNGVPAVGLRMATTKVFGLRAEKSKDNVHLDWSASNSNNIRKFEVQNSLNGNDFHSLGEILKDQLIDDFNFSFDHQSESKSNYYRVIAENQDLTLVISDVVKVKSLDKIDQVHVVPNPAKDVLGVSFSNDLIEEDKEIFVYDLSGKKIKTVFNDISASSVSLNIEDLGPGIYLLEVSSKSFSKRIKFVKQ